jgi:hypothetical protein
MLVKEDPTCLDGSFVNRASFRAACSRLAEPIILADGCKGKEAELK